MRSILVAACLSLLFAVAGTPVSAAGKPASRGAATAHALRLEGMDYLAARKIILAYGWQPFAGNCIDGTDAQTCAAFPEIDSCSCCGTAPCGMGFYKSGWCLSVATRGGPPNRNGPSDTVVEAIGFRKGECVKSPPS